MSDVTVTLERSNAVYMPGETITGTVRWQLADAPRRLEVVLFWATEGKGTSDTGVVAEQVHESPRMSGSVDFSFQLPEAPYSFSGQLVTFKWGVEAIFKKEKRHDHAAFVLSPTGEEWILPEPDPDVMAKRPGKKFKFPGSGR